MGWGAALPLCADKHKVFLYRKKVMNTEAEAESISVQIRIMEQATDVALALEKNDLRAAEENMFQISEDISLFKVLFGVDNYSFKNIEGIQNSLIVKLDAAKNKDGEYL